MISTSKPAYPKARRRKLVMLWSSSMTSTRGLDTTPPGAWGDHGVPNDVNTLSLNPRRRGGSSLAASLFGVHSLLCPYVSTWMEGCAVFGDCFPGWGATSPIRWYALNFKARSFEDKVEVRILGRAGASEPMGRWLTIATPPWRPTGMCGRRLVVPVLARRTPAS